MTTPTTAAVLAEADRAFDQSVARLIDLLRIPSVSSKPDHEGEVRRAAAWLTQELEALGFQAGVRETG